MKHLKNVLFAMVILLIGVITAGCFQDKLDSDDPDNPSNPDVISVKMKIDKIVPANIMKEIKQLGIPIYDGAKPPVLEGAFLADSRVMKQSNIQDDDPPGTAYRREIITLSEQDNRLFTIQLKRQINNEEASYKGIISGSGNNFTIWLDVIVEIDDTTTSSAVMIYSGTIKDGNIQNLHMGFFFTGEGYSGLGFVIREKDGIAEKIDGELPPEVPDVSVSFIASFNEKGGENIGKITIKDGKAEIKKFNGLFGWTNFMSRADLTEKYFTTKTEVIEGGKKTEFVLLFNLETMEWVKLPKLPKPDNKWISYYHSNPIISRDGKKVIYSTGIGYGGDPSEKTAVGIYYIESKELKKIEHVQFLKAQPEYTKEYSDLLMSREPRYISPDGRYLYGAMTSKHYDLGAIRPNFEVIYQYDFHTGKYKRYDIGDLKNANTIVGMVPDYKQIWLYDSKNKKMYRVDVKTGKSNLVVDEYFSFDDNNHMRKVASETWLQGNGYYIYTLSGNKVEENKFKNIRYHGGGAPYPSTQYSQDKSKIYFIGRGKDNHYICRLKSTKFDAEADTICSVPKNIKEIMLIHE